MRFYHYIFLASILVGCRDEVVTPNFPCDCLLIKKTSTGITFNEYEYEYDQNRRITAETIHYNGGDAEKYVYEWDDQDRLTRKYGGYYDYQISYLPNGRKKVSKSNDQGETTRIVEMTMHETGIDTLWEYLSSKTIPSMVDIRSYKDGNFDNRVITYDYGSDGTIDHVSKVNYTYDDKNNPYCSNPSMFEPKCDRNNMLVVESNGDTSLWRHIYSNEGFPIQSEIGVIVFTFEYKCN